MTRTQVRARLNGGGYKLVDAIAGVKVAGYTFWIHKCLTDPDRFSATYAPIGIGVTAYTSVAEVIEALDKNAGLIPKAIANTLADLANDHMPILAPECGIETNDWEYREQCKFENGEYRPVPNVIGSREYPKAHYVHLSVTKTESDFVAYTPNATYGENDRQVRLKFGKYLKKTFSDMSDAEIQTAVTALRAHLAMEESPASLQFTTERDKISEIFETEMYACHSSYASCMHDKFTGREVRPYHVYADSPDVAVAYVVERGQIVARSVVSTKRKRWVRGYSVKIGDSMYCQILANMLKREGYKEGSLVGSRLTKLPSRNGYPVLPYIDHGGMGVIDAGQYWEVCDEDEGDYICDQTDGTATERDTTPMCERCHREEEDCICIYCECCEESYQHGCDNCSMCEQCDSCITHDSCDCVRCMECSNIVNPTSRYTTACDCERCGHCGELQTRRNSDCECETCEKCEEYTDECVCESETDTDTETNTETDTPESPNGDVDVVAEYIAPEDRLEQIPYIGDEDGPCRCVHCQDLESVGV